MKLSPRFALEFITQVDDLPQDDLPDGFIVLLHHAKKNHFIIDSKHSSDKNNDTHLEVTFFDYSGIKAFISDDRLSIKPLKRKCYAQVFAEVAITHNVMTDAISAQRHTIMAIHETEDDVIDGVLSMGFIDGSFCRIQQGGKCTIMEPRHLLASVIDNWPLEGTVNRDKPNEGNQP